MLNAVPIYQVFIPTAMLMFCRKLILLYALNFGVWFLAKALKLPKFWVKHKNLHFVEQLTVLYNVWQ